MSATSALACAGLAAAATFLACLAASALWPRVVAGVRPGAARSALLGPLARVQDGVLSPRLRERIDVALRHAGRPAELTANELAALVEVSAATCFALALPFVCRGEVPVAVAPAAALFGAALPLFWLRDRVAARRCALVRALPHAADLLTLAVEAGLDFAAALAKVAEKGRGGALAIELSTALKELRFGKTREEALRGLAFRAGAPEVSTFVQALVHADRIGTPLGRVLRTLSTQLRIERAQRAEKLAHEAPVKLLFPLVAFIFPTLFLMLFGPIAYQVIFGGDV